MWKKGLITLTYICCFVIIIGGVDYSIGPYNVTFPVGSTNAPFDIIINDDNDNSGIESDESFDISITSITNDHNIGHPGVATVTIIGKYRDILA